MPTIEVYNLQKKKVGDVKIPDDFFPEKVSPGLINQVVNRQMANRRLGTSSVKNRHEVSGSTRKIYRQKGTGNARHGDIKAPIFVGGGQTFGPRPRDWSQDIPKKMRRKALRYVIGEKLREKKLFIADAIQWKEIKTKKALEVFHKLGIHEALVVLDHSTDAVIKSLRNVVGFKTAPVEGINIVDMLNHEFLVMTKVALDRIQEVWR